MKLRRSLSLIGAMLLGLTLTATPAQATGYQPSTPQPIQNAAPNNCQTIGQYNDHLSAGLEFPTNGLYEVMGAQATIAPYLLDCIDSTGLDDASGPSAWVGVQEPDPQANNRIVQMGVIKCHDWNAPTDSPCYGSREGTYRVWYAWGRDAGNCGLSAHIPRPIDLGIAVTPYTHHSYRVRYLNGKWYFYFDNTLVKTITDTLCWTTDSTTNVAIFSTERWDAADAVGTDAGTSTATYIHNMIKLQATSPSDSGTWSNANLDSDDCLKSGQDSSEGRCIYIIGSNDIGLYHVLQ